MVFVGKPARNQIDRACDLIVGAAAADIAAHRFDFHEYPMLRMNENPTVTVKVMATDNTPGGVGESGLPTMAPAIANTVAANTGKRMRSLPMLPGRRRKHWRPNRLAGNRKAARLFYFGRRTL
jgi:hypothetical protein